MPLVPRSIGGPLARLGAAAQNAFEVARFGGLETGEESSPYEIVAERPVYRLRRYFPDAPQRRPRPAVVLVPPMMLAADVYDVSPAATAVGVLNEHRVDPWVVDFGSPEHEEGGLERNLADHVLAVNDAVDRVREATGADVNLGGYSQGGMFCYQTAAYRRSEGIESVITFGSPVDLAAAIPFGLPEQVAARGIGLLADRLPALPAWASRTGFRLMDPVKSLRQRVDFVLALHDREALLPRERQRRFLEAEGWVAWPGPAMADFMRQFIAHNRMLEGGFVIDERTVTLADIECPVLSFVGEVDEIAPAIGVRAISRAAPRAEVYEMELRAGHFGLVVGSGAKETTWPTVAAWAHWRAGRGQLPKGVLHVEPDAEVAADSVAAVGRRVGYGLELAADVGGDVARSVAATTAQTLRTVRGLTREAVGQLPRLARLEQIQPSTRISLGSVLDEQAERAPDSVFFLFEGRAHAHRAAKERIDNVVRGLISIGVHQGHHVGVMMGTRPSALAVVAALSRLGAVAVLLRPGGDVAREAALGEVTRIIADPENAAEAARVGDTQTFVLGGGGDPRDLGDEVSDMERIDPDAVELPGWYRPNPGRAGELAFVLFSGEGERTRANRVSNGRWALSAFGVATSAALSSGDTVYSVTPLHHPSGILMSIGGAIAGGARIAMTTRFDPATFWDEVRRYGVTVASYTWTLLHELVQAPPEPGERGHPVRLFMGSGMPRGLWRRVEERFAPARVLEFYASTEGEAVLINVSGSKPGAMGRPLPGSADVRIARYDVERAAPVPGDDGFAQACEAEEVGMLMARSRRTNATAETLRGVFERDDAWLATGDLFRRDADGDFWLVDPVASVIRTPGGFVYARPVRDALEELAAVDLSVCYGVAAQGGKEVAVAAVTLREGASLRAADVTAALSGLPPGRRPAAVRVVEEIEVTNWYRPITSGLRAEGLVLHRRERPVWHLDPESNTYRPLTAGPRRDLLGEAADPPAARKRAAAKPRPAAKPRRPAKPKSGVS